MKLLATTALEETWGNDEDILFLGEWCKLYERKGAWKQRKFSVLNNHWDDRSKLKNDHDYLSNLHQKVLNELSKELNIYFNLNLTIRSWQIILDPWLLTHVSVLFDRWESIQNASKLENKFITYSFKYDEKKRVAFDYNNYINNVFTHEWNHIEFIRIMIYSYNNKFEIIELHDEIQIDKKNNNSKFSLKNLFFNISDLFFSLFIKNNKIVFYTTYFNFVDLFKLNVSLRQPIKFYFNIFKWPINELTFDKLEIDTDLRNTLMLKTSPLNKFESYLFNFIFHDIPVVYLEGFLTVYQSANKISLKPKLILSANAHWGNELFKCWSALMVNQNSKLITMEHGGGIHQTMNCMNFEEDIADFRTMWVNSYHTKHVKLPPNKKFHKIKSSNKYLAIIGFENSIYNYRVEASPKTSQYILHNEIIFGLYAEINSEIKDYFKVRPYFNMGYNTRNIYMTELGIDKISFERSLKSFFRDARILVCTYPQTTFTEAMYSNLPVILVYPKEIWETIPEMDELIKVLSKCNILFHDYKLAAKHINSIWEEPYSWWNSDEVKKARNFYLNHIMSDNNNTIAKWTKFIKSAIN